MWRRYNVGCMNDGGGNMWHGWVDNVSIRWRSQKGLTARTRWIGGSSEGGRRVVGWAGHDVCIVVLCCGMGEIVEGVLIK